MGLSSFADERLEPMTTDVQDGICASFQRAGRAHGYDRVSAGFFPFKDFKACWQRTGSTADFQVTDYLECANGQIIDEFADNLFKRIRSKGKVELYNDRMKEWFKTREFLDTNRPVYLRRSRNLAYRTEGKRYDLLDSFERLKAQGLVPDLPDTYITWTRTPNRSRLGYCSILMRVIAISSALDTDKVPEFVPDYVLYHELLHLRTGLKSGGRYHDKVFKDMEKIHPRHREAEDWLKRIAAKKI
jgi:predicted metal-dependent hydrolase